MALQKIAEVLREADAVRGLIRDNMAKLLNLQNQLANRRDMLAKIRSDIDKAREESGQQLFVLDSLPLWEALFRVESADVILVQVLQSSQRFAEDLQEFPQKYGDRIVWHAIYFLAMVVLFYFLRRGLTPEAAERMGVPAAIFFLDRPFSTSFLLAVLALPFLYPGAAVSVLRIAILPNEADSPLIVDPDAQLPGAPASERFEPVSRRVPRVLNRARRVELAQLPQSPILNFGRVIRR